jgi:hypothetical protein
MCYCGGMVIGRLKGPMAVGAGLQEIEQVFRERIERKVEEKLEPERTC